MEKHIAHPKLKAILEVAAGSGAAAVTMLGLDEIHRIGLGVADAAGVVPGLQRNLLTSA